MKRYHPADDDDDLDEDTSFDKEDKFHAPTQSSQRNERKRRRGFIEKRRRDRINHSLLELKKLIPTVENKQDTSKLEKAEILQMAVDYLKKLKKEKDNHTTTTTTSIDDNNLNNFGFKECLTIVSDFFQKKLDSPATNLHEIRDSLTARIHLAMRHFETKLPSLVSANGSPKLDDITTSQNDASPVGGFHPDPPPGHLRRLPPPYGTAVHSDHRHHHHHRRHHPSVYSHYYGCHPTSQYLSTLNHLYPSNGVNGFLEGMGHAQSTLSSSSSPFLSPSPFQHHQHFVQSPYDQQFNPPSSSSSSSLSSSPSSSFYPSPRLEINPGLLGYALTTSEFNPSSSSLSSPLSGHYGNKPYRPWGWEVTC